GSWSKLKETYARVEPLQRIYPNLKISILTTVTEQNFQAFPKFIDELAETFAPDQINVLLHRNKDRHSPLPAPVLSAYNAAIDRYLQLLNGKRIGTLNMASGLFLRIKEFVQKDIIYRVAQKDEFVTPCQAGKLSYVIWEDGRMAPCEMRDDRIGNILEESVQSLVRNQYSQALRKDIKDSKCKCTYECAMSINSFFSFPGNLALLKGIFTFLQSGRLSRPHSDKFAGPR
ncbi:MAG: SPASM domain-containing protein, partial [Bdellovibrionota bacterium]